MRATLGAAVAVAIAALGAFMPATARADYNTDAVQQALGYAFSACEQGLAGTKSITSAISEFDMNLSSARSAGEKYWPASFRGHVVRDYIATCQRDLPNKKRATEEKAKADDAARARQAELDAANAAAAEAVRQCKKTLAMDDEMSSHALIEGGGFYRSSKAEALAKAKGTALGPIDGQPASAAFAMCDAGVAKKIATKQAAERAAIAAKTAKDAAERAAWQKQVAALRGDRLKVFKAFNNSRPEFAGKSLAEATRWAYTDMVSPGGDLEFRCTTVFVFTGDKLAKKFNDGMGCKM